MLQFRAGECQLGGYGTPKRLMYAERLGETRSLAGREPTRISSSLCGLIEWEENPPPPRLLHRNSDGAGLEGSLPAGLLIFEMLFPAVKARLGLGFRLVCFRR